MSGAMVKLGFYGILRVILVLGGATPAFGVLLGVLGLAGALVGISLALSQRDLKRALAFSSVENLGLIAFGLGIGMTGLSMGDPGLAAFGFAAGLFHVWTHAAMKGLLFFAAGERPARHRHPRSRAARRLAREDAAPRSALRHRCAGPGRAAAAERLCERVAALPRAPARRDGSFAARVARLGARHRTARADGRARGSRVRAPVRHGLPRSCAQHRDPRGSRRERGHAGCHGGARPRLHHARNRSDRPAAGRCSAAARAARGTQQGSPHWRRSRRHSHRCRCLRSLSGRRSGSPAPRSHVDFAALRPRSTTPGPAATRPSALACSTPRARSRSSSPAACCRVHSRRRRPNRLRSAPFPGARPSTRATKSLSPRASTSRSSRRRLSVSRGCADCSRGTPTFISHTCWSLSSPR